MSEHFLGERPAPTLLQVAEVVTVQGLALSDIGAAELLWSPATVANAICLFYLPSWAGRSPQDVFEVLRALFMEDISTAVTSLRTGLAEKKPQAINSFRKRMQNAIKRYAYRAYEQGARKEYPNEWRGFNSRDIENVKGIIEEEYQYLRGFLNRIRQSLRMGLDLTGRLDWNANLYAQSLRKCYQAGILARAGRGDLVTVSRGNPRDTSCAACPPRWGTYGFEEYMAMNPPPSNWCLGLSNCHCIVTVHKQLGLFPLPRMSFEEYRSALMEKVNVPAVPLGTLIALFEKGDDREIIQLLDSNGM